VFLAATFVTAKSDISCSASPSNHHQSTIFLIKTTITDYSISDLQAIFYHFNKTPQLNH
jgi:hypothetical protein